MEDLSQRKPPQLTIKAEDTTPTGENGALVWSTSEGRHLTYNENAGRWGVVGVYPVLGSIRMPTVEYYTFADLVGISSNQLQANNQFFLPFYMTEDRVVNTMGYEVTTAASSGSAAVGIYNTQVVNGISMPYELLTSATGMDITSTGIKTATVSPSITLRAGVLYWASIYTTQFVNVRSCVSPTRMLVGPFINPIYSIRRTNNSGNLVNPAPTTNYLGAFFLPILIYT